MTAGHCIGVHPDAGVNRICNLPRHFELRAALRQSQRGFVLVQLRHDAESLADAGAGERKSRLLPGFARVQTQTGSRRVEAGVGQSQPVQLGVERGGGARVLQTARLLDVGVRPAALQPPLGLVPRGPLELKHNVDERRDTKPTAMQKHGGPSPPYFVSHAHHLAHLQVLHRGTQVSDWTESQAAVTLMMKVRRDVSDRTMKHKASKTCLYFYNIRVQASTLHWNYIHRTFGANGRRCVMKISSALFRYWVVFLFTASRRSLFGSTPTILVAKAAIVLIWVLAVGIMCPAAMALTVDEVPFHSMVYNDDFNQTFPLYSCYENFSNPQMRKVYTAVLFAHIYLVPLTVITLMYGGIGGKLCSTMVANGEPQPANVIVQVGRRRAGQHMISQKKVKVIKMLILVALLFMLSWLPLWTLMMMTDYAGLDRDQLDLLTSYIFPFAHWLAFSNSGINPIIYGYYNENFKRGFQAVCKSKPFCGLFQCEQWEGGAKRGRKDRPNQVPCGGNDFRDATNNHNHLVIGLRNRVHNVNETAETAEVNRSERVGSWTGTCRCSPPLAFLPEGLDFLLGEAEESRFLLPLQCSLCQQLHFGFPNSHAVPGLVEVLVLVEDQGDAGGVRAIRLFDRSGSM
ncbi:Neuropeptide FF receptor 2 [Liparis tanakae]|uniref:Neuropeptide FF receptor 2 n=1 Tax=Liparis tanakae TaxID=230148 RepID=A0A4Z2IFX9_9TELE|nr:Neuropeptide FF receptor 2 [Liparis tanakae]